MHPATILIIDDEVHIQRALRRILSESGYRVLVAALGEDGLAQAAAEQPDVIILDLGLPDMEGTEVCTQIRQWTSVPIIVLSARDDQREKVRALDAGADDYLTKPFGVDELLARVRVALRHKAQQRAEAEAIVTSDNVVVDLVRHSVSLGGQEVHLTATEYNLLAYLAQHSDRVLTHRAILHHVWGQEYESQIEYLRVYMRQLRGKLEARPQQPRILITEPGVGYRFVKN